MTGGVCFSFFFWLRVLDKAEYSAFKSTLNSPIVSYRIVWSLKCHFKTSLACGGDISLSIHHQLLASSNSHLLLVSSSALVLSSCTSGPVNTWMGDHLWARKPSRYVTSHLGQLSLLSLRDRLIEYQPFWLGLGGESVALTCVHEELYCLSFNYWYILNNRTRANIQH